MKLDVPITIRYAETDMMGVVYHANYLLYFEDARTKFLEAIDYPYERVEEAGYISPVVNVAIDYRVPLRYGEHAIVRTYVSELKATRTVFSYEVYCKGQNLETEKPHATGQTTLCLVQAGDFKPVSIKRVLPELYRKYQEVLEP